MFFSKFILKINQSFFKIKCKIIYHLLNTWIYMYLYKCYWRYKFSRKIKTKENYRKNYLTINVNSGAGIGHQLANYNSSLFYSKKLGLKHAHSKFPDTNWEKLLGINFKKISCDELISNGYKKVQLPRFQENNKKEMFRIKKIIDLYYNEKIIFFLEIDQPYTSQHEMGPILQKYFFLSPQRRKDKVLFKKNEYNIAVHIRAGDILANKFDLKKRFLNLNYFTKAIQKCLLKINTKKQIKIYVFSENYLNSFYKLKQFKNLKFFVDLDQYKTFLHFIYADCLITSKSSFSYKAALINRGLKFCPKNFWHKYPKNKKKWILIDN